ncbi:MAG: autophagy protein atg9 [Stictis urceolatum]|nr:autophagy protein atg9 [Stictis urceolata]
MASNIISRLMPPGTSPSIYETMKEYDDDSDTDIEERAGLSEQPRYRDNDLDSALNDAIDGSTRLDEQPSSQEEPFAGPSSRRVTSRQRNIQQTLDGDEADDDVPAELLVETDEVGNPIASPDLPAKRQRPLPKPIPALGQTSGAERAKWDATQQQQQLHKDHTLRPAYTSRPRPRGGLIVDPKEKAMWRWTNVQNLDVFLQNVYEYYCEKGIYSIMLSRIINLLIFAFVVGFSTFLTACIDYSKLRDSKKMSDIYVKQCSRNLSSWSYILIWLCSFFWIAQLVRLVTDIPRLKQYHDFFHYLLDVPDTDIQTVSWQEIVKRLMALRDSNPTTSTKISNEHRKFLQSQSKQRMDAHDIANRLMRRDNYLIAMINKDALDLTLPIPYFRNRPILSRTLEWNLSMCILDYIFDDKGQVRPIFLKDNHRKDLSLGLRRRFLVIGVLNLFIGPFMLSYGLVLWFLRNFTEYQKDPASIGSRQFTPFAKWKFREFNELSHLFQRRINMSYPFASRYINQFPKDKMAQLAQFVTFVTGALAAVLGLISLLDPDLFLGFEITHDKTVLFYLGIFGTVWAFARNSIPEENLVFDPEWTMNDVIHFTHYEPNNWKGRLHSDEVRRDFIGLYQLKLVIFLQEILSMATTPFILCLSLPQCSERIIDFIREFTIHVDGLGYVCSFAVFDFAKNQNATTQTSRQPIGAHAPANAPPEDPRDDYYSAKDNKMLASYYNFMDHYATNPHSRPGQVGHHQAHSSRQFHPPPAFPGLMSSHLHHDTQPHSPYRTDDTDRHPVRSRIGFRAGAGSQRTPRFAPTAATVGHTQSPMTSILLDPHHQPSSGLKSSHKPRRSTYLATSRRVEDVIEDEEGEEEVSRSDRTSGHGDLGESWMMKARKEDEDSADEEDGNEGFGGGEGPGTLGLVYQIVKEQTADRGTGAQL